MKFNLFIILLKSVAKISLLTLRTLLYSTCIYLFFGANISRAEDQRNIKNFPRNAKYLPETSAQDFEKYKPLEGKIIRSIRIHIVDMFEDDTRPIYQHLNKLKIKTREEVVRIEMTIKEGQPFSALAFSESERNLRSLKFFRRVSLLPQVDGDVVDIDVYVQDTWTIVPQFTWSSGQGRKRLSAGVSDSDLLGLGKRLELLYNEDDQRQSIQAVWDDPRLWGTKNQLTLGYFNRNDGKIFLSSIGRPYRTLVEKHAWNFQYNLYDTIGRLFSAATEEYIFRQKRSELLARYSIANTSDLSRIRRLYFGYTFREETFSKATREDYADLKLDPNEVSNDPSRLANDRRFSGATFAYEVIEPQYITMNYIDRFDRWEDYNIGEQYSINAILAPEFLGSLGNNVVAFGNYGQGEQFSDDSFLRGEIGYSSWYDQDGFQDSLWRGELKYYNVLGLLKPYGVFLGRHTLAFSAAFDYGLDITRDKQFTLGADTGLRGYKARTFDGDKRLVLNLEDRFHIIDNVLEFISLGGAFFVEGGAASRNPFADMIADQFYSTIGFGFRIGFPRSSGGQVLRLDVAFPMRDGPDGSDAWSPRILFTSGQIFSSRTRSELLGAQRASVEFGIER